MGTAAAASPRLPPPQVLVGPGGGKESENAFVGGQNRWRYDSFVNWEFWWPAFPVLVYFKARAGPCCVVAWGSWHGGWHGGQHGWHGGMPYTVNADA